MQELLVRGIFIFLSSAIEDSHMPEKENQD